MGESHDSAAGVTRRAFLSIASAVALTSGTLDGATRAADIEPASQASGTPPPAGSPQSGLAIDLLGLDPATRADLEALAQPILRETRWLDELPLDDVRPAFIFDPMEGWR